MPVPVVFRKNERFNKNYDFVSALTGMGVQVLHLSTTTQNSGGGRIILSQATESSGISSNSGQPTGSFTKLQDYDHDAVVNTNFTLDGIATFNFTVSALGGGADTVDGYLIIKIRKWDGTTETEVASVQTTERSSGAGAQTYFREQVEATITKTAYTPGDTLRITVEVWAKDDGSSGSNQFIFYHDPANRTQVDTDNKSTAFTGYLPVVIQ